MKLIVIHNLQTEFYLLVAIVYKKVSKYIVIWVPRLLREILVRM